MKLNISEQENINRITNSERALRYKSTQIEEKDRNRKLIQISHPNLLEIEISELSPQGVAQNIFAFMSKNNG